MATNGLILSIRKLSIGSHRLISPTTVSRGCSTAVSENVRVFPQPTLHHPYTTHLSFPLTSSQETKAREMNLAARLAPASDISIETPGFRKSNIRIGHLPATKITAILDPTVSVSLIGDLVPNKVTDIVGDNPQSLNRPAYKARHIQKIRRWKMNRHKLVKLRKRTKTKRIRRSYAQYKKKVAKTKAYCKAILQDGEQFDALEFVKERLTLAKTGGFVQDIWREPHDQPEVPWKPYSFSKVKIKKYETKVKPPYFPTQAEIRAMRKAMKKKKQQ